MLKHDIGFFKAFDSIHLNPYESQLSSASDKYNPSYPRLSCLSLENIALMRHCTIVQMISTCNFKNYTSITIMQKNVRSTLKPKNQLWKEKFILHVSLLMQR